MKRLMAAAACALSLLVSPPIAQDKPAEGETSARTGIQWQSDLDQALALAAKEDKPLFVAFLMDDEAGNDETVRSVHTNPELIKLSRKFVCVGCNAGSKAGADGTSASYPGVAVAAQQALEKKARARWMKSDLVVAPQHVFCDSKGNEVGRKVYLHSADQLCKAMRLVLAGGKEADAETQKALQDEKTRVDQLLKDAVSNNLEVRNAALRELAVADDERALPAVLQCTKNGTDDMTRTAAIQALAKKGNHKAITPLLELLGDKKAPVVVAAVRALGTIQIPDAAPELLVLLKKDQRERVKNPALRAAARCHPENQKVLELALACCKPTSSTQMQAAAIVALGFLKPTAKSREALLKCLGEKNQNLRGLAVWALGNHRNPEDAARLEKLAADDKSPELREFAVRAAKYCRGEKVEEFDSLYARFFYDYEN